MTNGTSKYSKGRMSKSKKSFSKKNKKPRKKSFKKSNSKVSQLTQQLKQLQLLNKLNIQTFRIGCREANNLNQVGKEVLLNHDSSNSKPIHIYPLSNIYQSGSTEPSSYYLTSDMYDLVSLGTNLEHMGSGDNTIQDVDNMKVRNLIHNYSNIQLTLRGQSSRTSVFTCYLVKFKDNTFDPSENTTVSGALSQRLRSSFFSHLLRSNMNPCIQGEKLLTNDVKKMFSIIWKKQYKIREGLSTEDVQQHKYVKIFRPLNKIVTYNHDGNPVTSTGINQDDPDAQLGYVDPSLMTFRNYPRIDQNLFFIITGNCPEDNQSCTYDINIVNKFTSSDRISQT